MTRARRAISTTRRSWRPSATVASAAAIEGAGTRLTLVVPEPVAERVTAYVAAGRVALVQAPVGGDE